MNKVFENNQFIILGEHSKNRPAYILYNKHKEFSAGHTHLDNYNTALWIMKLYLSRKLPHDLKSEYLIKSLIRISDDENYTKKAEQLLEAKKNKSNDYYINVQKGVNNKKKGRKK